MVGTPVIADLHCHYPMHLVHDELEPHRKLLSWWDTVKGDVEEEVFDLAARLINNPGWGDGWRVDLDGLRDGGVDTVCSVLYWPSSELIPGGGAHPKPGSFEHLIEQLDDVEAHLSEQVIVRTLTDLDRPGPRFVHCVEGGFHLGPDRDQVDANVAVLAQRGIFYITLAHLFFRGVAANAPAIPMLTDAEYRLVFHQDAGIGLTDLGEAALRAMVDHDVVVDISHMRTDAVQETFRLLAQFDPERRLPVIASHVAVRSQAPGDQEYNIDVPTMEQIRDRDGVIGLILAEHQIGDSDGDDQSREIIARHIRAIFDALKTHAHTAIGTDLDGFIKPTLAGLQRAADLHKLETWIREDFPGDADAILHDNATRVIKRVFALRAGAA
jgi:microsomal dipeptidase-like Zn-dependent dipeptidase